MALTLQQVTVAPLWADSWLPAVGQLWLKHLSELCGVPLESEPQSWVWGALFQVCSFLGYPLLALDAVASPHVCSFRGPFYPS